ncbi:DUF1660 family phage protein [Sphingomonas piscis]
MRLLCRLFGHRRSGAHAEYSRARRRWRSVCKRCDTPLAKVNGKWMTIDQADRTQREPQPR